MELRDVLEGLCVGEKIAVNLRVKTISQIVQELVPEYLEARKRELRQMYELLAAADFARLRVLSHSLKGSGGSFGFKELSQFGGCLERHAEASDSISFGRELVRLQQYLDSLD